MLKVQYPIRNMILAKSVITIKTKILTADGLPFLAAIVTKSRTAEKACSIISPYNEQKIHEANIKNQSTFYNGRKMTFMKKQHKVVYSN